MFDSLPEAVSIYEVSPRDGLQNESAQVATHAKVRLIEALVDAGLKRVEVTSFVSPKWVPQMADADQVCQMIERREGVTYSALVPNARGLERAMAARRSALHAWKPALSISPARSFFLQPK